MSDIHHNAASRRGCEVTIQSVSKRYSTHLVLDDVSMTIRPGEFFTLLGPSGCGKTTLLRSVAGFHAINSGHILFDGVDVSTRAPWDRNIGFVFQNYALWPNKTIFDNVAYGLNLRKISREDIRKRVRLALAQVQLRHVEDRYPAEMSGGMQQRIAMARALVIDPPLLLLDEPMSNLDAKLRVSLRQELRELQQRIGVTAIYVTHDQEEALELSDRIAVMKGGKVDQLACPEAVYSRPETRFVADFVGQANFIDGVLEDQGFRPDEGPFLNIIDPSNRGRATFFVRPESVHFCEPGTGACDVTVTDVRYIGRAWVHTLSFSPLHSLSAEASAPLPRGKRVGITFDNPRFMKGEA
ncbi:ABC transporter ATP-binding protein [Pantoea ananatis]|uniref:ABC transporter ATP-binding protein n=1 Tax=Pantoea ananas TaxID=553 RepID=UPI001F4DAA5C|nr:ABC transporter ATP-binding protein [Pantoea ananatis]MCH9271887.1 ABC transporter ATP-binding protein [Pantoea ananatis]